MADFLRLPDLALGELELDVLKALWEESPLHPSVVHQRVGEARGVSVNTVCSALKRLQAKGLLDREKVSHAYVYRPLVMRAALQRQLIDGIADQFGEDGGAALLAAFVDLAEARGEDSLKRLEELVAARIAEEEP